MDEFTPAELEILRGLLKHGFEGYCNCPEQIQIRGETTSEAVEEAYFKFLVVDALNPELVEKRRKEAYEAGQRAGLDQAAEDAAGASL